MTETTIPASAEVLAERDRITAALLEWAQGAGYGNYANTALRAVGLAGHLPRTSAEVQVTVVGTVTVPINTAGQWTREDALRALDSAVRNNRADYEAHEVTAPGAPSAE